MLNSDENVPGPSTLDDVSLEGDYKYNLYSNSATARREETERGDVFVHFSGNSVLACVGNLEGVALQNVFSNKLINKNL